MSVVSRNSYKNPYISILEHRTVQLKENITISSFINRKRNDYKQDISIII